MILQWMVLDSGLVVPTDAQPPPPAQHEPDPPPGVLAMTVTRDGDYRVSVTPAETVAGEAGPDGAPLTTWKRFGEDRAEAVIAGCVYVCIARADEYGADFAVHACGPDVRGNWWCINDEEAEASGHLKWDGCINMDESQSHFCEPEQVMLHAAAILFVYEAGARWFPEVRAMRVGYVDASKSATVTISFDAPAVTPTATP